MNHKIYIEFLEHQPTIGPGFDLLGMALKIYNEFFLQSIPIQTTPHCIDNTPPFAGRKICFK